MRKRRIALLIVLVMILQLLAGCKAGKAPASASGEKSDKVLKLGIVAKGYGDEFAKQLAVAFEKKTGIKTEVAKSSVSGDWVGAQLLAGESINDIDVFFDIRHNAMADVAKTNYLKGYERAYVDLSDIYDKVPEGYDTDKTLEELVDPYALKSVTWDLEGEGFGDGKQYFVNYMAGIEGIVYNKKLFQQYKLKEPRTTTEFFALLEQMKKLNNGTYAKNEYGKDIYPFGYSGKVNYMNFLARVWWAQYDGIEAFGRVFEGKDAAGNYTAECYKAPGKLSALNQMSKLLAEESGYSDPSCYSINFTDARKITPFMRKLSDTFAEGYYIPSEDYKLTNRFVQGMVDEVVLNFLSHTTSNVVDPEETNVVSSAKIQSLIQWINEHYADSVSVQDAAEEINLSVKYFSSYFKRHVGMSFNEYIYRTRVSHAMDMLDYTNMSMKEICYETGFVSSAHFTKTFIKYAGITPTAYRNRVKE